MTTLAYDAVGNVTSRVDGRGLRTSYLYDALDRQSVVAKPEGTRSSFAYDAVGQLLTVGESFGVTSMSYDAVGRVLSVALPSGARLSYGYDSIGNRTWMADDKGARTSYVYAPVSTSADYLTVAPPYENATTEVRFDKLGRVDFKGLAGSQASRAIQRFLPNGWKAYHSYGDSGGVEQNFFGLAYDAAGNRTRVQERNGGSGSPSTYTYFGYDAGNQLINERRADVPGYNVTYVYDGTGNRLAKNDGGVLTTYSYGAGNRLLQEVTGSAVTSYSYDQNGNQTLINAGGARTSYAWDGENSLAQVTQPDGTVEKHEYSHEGLRRKKQKTDANNVTTTQNFVWDTMSLVQVRNESNLLLANYTWAPETWDGFWSGGDLMDVLLLERNANTAGDLANGVSRYHGEDPSYNTRLLIEPNGSVSDRFSYQAFGELWNHLGGGMSPFLFGGALGYWFDALRRIEARYRVVDPKTGRWIKPDSTGFYGGSWNLFGYVGNDPVSWIDPTGARRRGIAWPGFDYWGAYPDPALRGDVRRGSGGRMYYHGKGMSDWEKTIFNQLLNKCPTEWPGGAEAIAKGNTGWRMFNPFNPLPVHNWGRTEHKQRYLMNWLFNYTRLHVPGCKDKIKDLCPPPFLNIIPSRPGFRGPSGGNANDRFADCMQNNFKKYIGVDAACIIANFGMCMAMTSAGKGYCAQYALSDTKCVSEILWNKKGNEMVADLLSCLTGINLPPFLSPQ